MIVFSVRTLICKIIYIIFPCIIIIFTVLWKYDYQYSIRWY